MYYNSQKFLVAKIKTPIKLVAYKYLIPLGPSVMATIIVFLKKILHLLNIELAVFLVKCQQL